VLVTLRLLLATVRGGLLFWRFRSLAAPLCPLDDELRALPVLRLALGKVLGFTFREHS